MRRALMVAAVLGMLAAGRAEAAFATYTQTATASGSLGGRSFINAAITFTQTADTNDVATNTMAGLVIYTVRDLTSTVSVAGLGAASFTAPTFTASQTGLGLGLGLVTAGVGGPIVIAVGNPAGGTYDLRTSIGPLPGTVSPGPPGTSYTTSAGLLLINSYSGVATFQAVVATAAVPEPASAGLLATGLLGAGLSGWRRARRAAA